jgi:hypothetical protein
MVVVANGVKVFIVALPVQKYSDANWTRIVLSKYNHPTTNGLDIY